MLIPCFEFRLKIFEGMSQVRFKFCDIPHLFHPFHPSFSSTKSLLQRVLCSPTFTILVLYSKYAALNMKEGMQHIFLGNDNSNVYLKHTIKQILTLDIGIW